MTDHPDIVERLSELADGYEEIAELDEAAAEITRLRAEAEALRKALVELVACEQQREEISRRKQRRENSRFAHPEAARAIKAEHSEWKVRKSRAWNCACAAIAATKEQQA